MNKAAKSMSPYEWVLLVSLSVLWGGSFFFVGIAVRELPPLTVVAARVCLAAVALTAVVLLSGLRLPTERSVWLAFFGMGLLNNVIPFSLIAWGQTHIGGGLASILNATTPFFTVIAAHYLTGDEKATSARVGGVLVGFIGVVLMVGLDALAGFGGSTLAQLAVLGAALCYCFAGIFGRRFRRLGIRPLVTATGQVTASTLLLLPVALVADRPWTLAQPGWDVWAALSGLALFSTALAYLLYFRILSTAGATNVVLVTLLIPVSAILLGVTLLGERLEPNQVAGMICIGGGLLLMDGRLTARVKGRRFSRLLNPAPLKTSDRRIDHDT